MIPQFLDSQYSQPQEGHLETAAETLSLLSPKTTIEPRMDADEHGYRQQLQEQEEKRLGSTSVHSSVLLGLDPFRKQSVSPASVRAEEPPPA